MKNLRLISDTYRQPIVKASFSFDLKQYAFKGHLEAKKPILLEFILWHSSSKPTEIYTHVTKKGFENLKSPFDALKFKNNDTMLFSHKNKIAKQHNVVYTIIGNN